MLPGGMLHQGLPHDERSLLDSDNSSLNHNPVLTDHTVVNKSTHGGDALLSKISLSLTTGVVSLLSNAVDLLVHLSTMEVTVLTGTGDSVRNTGRVP